MGQEADRACADGCRGLTVAELRIPTAAVADVATLSR